ncbi:DNA repair protein [Xanthomonas maliensis]|nr:DNA repair protein [Xanthomonas maliensis]
MRYQIQHVLDGRVVASGVTGQDGRTSQVVATAAAKPTAGGVLPFSRPSYSMLDDGVERYRLLVWEAKLSRYIEADLHPAEKNTTAILALQPSELVAFQVLKTQQLILKRHVRVRFRFKQGNKPIPGAPYVAYTFDKDGKQITAKDLDGKPIKGNTDKQGETDRIFTDDKCWFVFNLPGADKLSYTSDAFEPRVGGADAAMYEVSVKSQVAVASPGKGTVSKVNGKVSAPAVLNAHDEELLLLTPEVWKEFEAVSGHIESTFAGVHQSRYALNQALQGRDPEAIKQAEKDLNGAEDKVAEMLNKDFSKKADLVEVVTFESYNKGANAPGANGKEQIGLRRRYIPRTKYEQYKQRRIKGVPVNVKLSASQKVSHSGPVEGEVGRKASTTHSDKKTFDAAKFMEDMKKISTELKTGTSVKADPWVADILDMGANQFAETVKKSDNYTVESSAQWMRLVAGAGASSEVSWDTKKGDLKAKASVNAQAKLILFEGKWVHTLAVPSSKGWQMCFGGMDLGAIVFQLACELYGFVGAKAALTGAVGVSYNGSKASVQPRPRDRQDSLANRFDERSGLPRADLGDPPGPNGARSQRIVPAALNEKPPEDINGMQVNAEIFAGAEAGLTPSGELQWLPPNQSKPVSFAKLSLDVAVSAGAGASGQLNIYYANGKFRVKASARLCWGVGAKGALDFVVESAGILEFVKWVYYQLAHAGFKVLVYFARDAFMALSQVLFLAIARDSDAGIFLSESLGQINGMLKSVMNSLERADNRYKLVSSINKKSEWLIHATPETRGMLLYALTRHDWATHWNNAPEIQRKGLDIQVHYLNEHKRAIINVVKCVKLSGEWINMLQHMSMDGSKIADAGKADGDVMRFLNYGLSLTSDLKSEVFDKVNSNPGWRPEGIGNSYLEEYNNHRRTLLGAFPKGYEVAQLNEMGDQQLAMLDGVVSPSFAQIDPEYLWMDRDGARTMLAMEHGRSLDDGADTRMA